MKPSAYMYKLANGNIFFDHIVNGLSGEQVPLYDVPEGYAVCPDRRHPEAILGDMGVDDDGKMVQNYSYQTDRRCRKERRKVEDK